MTFSLAAGEKLLLQGKCGCRRRRSALVKQLRLGKLPESKKMVQLLIVNKASRNKTQLIPANSESQHTILTKEDNKTAAKIDTLQHENFSPYWNDMNFDMV